MHTFDAMAYVAFFDLSFEMTASVLVLTVACLGVIAWLTIVFEEKK